LFFELFDVDVRQFLKAMPLQVPGMRHVLRSVLDALAFMHANDVLRADLKSGNVLLIDRLLKTARGPL
jgi:serine/threonine protein kinase